MNRLLLVTPLAIALAACQVGGTETRSAGSASCTPVGSACAQNQDCCSYGCQSGICAPNPLEGGTCVTTDDCTYGHLCKSGACTTQTVGMCRDDADVCSVRSQCCSGNCLGARCTVNRAPVASAGADVPDAPYTQVFTLQNLSSDPDGDPMTFGWSIVSAPAGSTAQLSSTIAATPSFTADKIGTYVVHLVVTDGPAGTPYRLTSQDEVTIVAVNRAPVANVTVPPAATPPATSSRNVAMTFSGNVSDPDGDTLECQWRITLPGAATPVDLGNAFACWNPSSPSVPYTPTLEGAYQVDLVVRDHDRTTGLVVNTTIASRTFTSVNNPPTPRLNRTSYFANLGVTPADAVPVTLDASTSTDVNGDALTFAWTPLGWPGQGTGSPAPTLDTTNPQVATFTPAAAGDYTIQVTVSDPPLGARPSSSSSLVATVHVGRAVKDLGPLQIVDADVAHGAGTSGVVAMVGPNPANPAQGMLWRLDLATRAVIGSGIQLGETPTTVGVSPDGTVAVVGSANWVFVVPLDGGAVRPLSQASPSDVVLTGPDQGGKRRAFVFLSSPSATVKILDLSNDSWTSTTVYGQKGALDTVGDRLYVRESASLRKYAIGGGGALNLAATGSYAKSCMSVWASRHTETHIFTGCADIIPVPPLTTTLTVTGTLASPAPTVRHLDTAADGSGVYAVTGSPDEMSIRRFDTSLTPLAADPLPHWSWDGLYRGTSAVFTFTDGTSRWAIVAGSPGGTARTGLVTFP